MTTVGAVRGADASWNPAQSRAELAQAVRDNLRNLGVDVLDVVNLRVMGDAHAPSEASFLTLLTFRSIGHTRSRSEGRGPRRAQTSPSSDGPELLEPRSVPAEEPILL